MLICFTLNDRLKASSKCQSCLPASESLGIPDDPRADRQQAVVHLDEHKADRVFHTARSGIWQSVLATSRPFCGRNTLPQHMNTWPMGQAVSAYSYCQGEPSAKRYTTVLWFAVAHTALPVFRTLNYKIDLENCSNSTAIREAFA